MTAAPDQSGTYPGTVLSPLEISRVKEPAERAGINLRWSDGVRHFIPAAALRRECPCATCLEARGESSHSNPLSPAPKRPKLFTVLKAGVEEQTEIVQLWPIGNYALGVRWGDKHDSGIYDYPLLRRLGQAADTATES